MLTYGWRHRRLPQLTDPQRFTEFVQQRKLENRDPFQHVLMDKLAAKRMAADALGAEWAIATLWQAEELPAQDPAPGPSIVKARHGCNQYHPIWRPNPDAWEKLRPRTQRWMASHYGFWLDEWAYKDVPRGLFAEALLGDGRTLPVDYKIYVFGGRATHVQVHLGRGMRHRWMLHDRDWQPLVPTDDMPPRPISLPDMLAAAETLAAGAEFLRVDFFEIAGRPLFGEFCLYPGSGLDPFAAEWIDDALGRLWSAAAASRQPAAVNWTKTSSRSASRVVTSSIA